MDEPICGITDLFPQPLVKMDIDHHVAVSVFKNIVKRKAGFQDIIRTYGLTNYYNAKNVFELFSELQPVHDEIVNKANYIYQEIYNVDNELRVTNAWYNECELGSAQIFHNHCNSVLSGTLYLKTDSNTCIQFRSPYSALPAMHNQIRDKVSKKPNRKGHGYHQNYHTVFIRDGHCLFWPSFMMHGYPDNQTPNRLSLSFNMMPKQVNGIYKI